MLSNGHGKYEELADEKEFFNATNKSDKVVCLFYLPSNFRYCPWLVLIYLSFNRCKIVDKHFEKLAPKYVGVRFIHVNAEKVCCISIIFILCHLVTIPDDSFEHPCHSNDRHHQG